MPLEESLKIMKTLQSDPEAKWGMEYPQDPEGRFPQSFFKST